MGVMAGLSAVLYTATCAAAQVAEMPVQQLEEEVESIVEKHQLEEMERASNTQKEGEDDDIEPELQRIKDDEDIHEQDTREPDIPVAAALPPLPLEEKAAPMQAQAPMIVPAKIPATTTTHVKTPDEVEDLPEHEAVDQISGSDQIMQEQENIVDDMEVSAAESNAVVEAAEVEELSPAEEKKIALDLQEKETCDEKEKHSEEEENEEAKVKTPM